jgi:hypothetical protein
MPGGGNARLPARTPWEAAGASKATMIGQAPPDDAGTILVAREGAMTIDIQLVETDGVHWVNLSMDGHEMERRGPYPDADTAEAMAMRIAAVCRAMHTEVHHAAPTPAKEPAPMR